MSSVIRVSRSRSASRRNTPPEPRRQPVPQPQQTRKQTDPDVLNVCKSIAGLMTQLAGELEVQARDTRVPVNEVLLSRLVAKVKPGVTIRGLVERAVTDFLERDGQTIPEAVEVTIKSERDRGTSRFCRCGRWRRATS